eukprot:ANDGO_03330.mRNA.1 ELMO domain-containing protein B
MSALDLDDITPAYAKDDEQHPRSSDLESHSSPTPDVFDDTDASLMHESGSKIVHRGGGGDDDDDFGEPERSPVGSGQSTPSQTATPRDYMEDPAPGMHSSSSPSAVAAAAQIPIPVLASTALPAGFTTCTSPIATSSTTPSSTGNSASSASSASSTLTLAPASPPVNYLPAPSISVVSEDNEVESRQTNRIEAKLDEPFITVESDQAAAAVPTGDRRSDSEDSASSSSSTGFPAMTSTSKSGARTLTLIVSLNKSATDAHAHGTLVVADQPPRSPSNFIHEPLHHHTDERLLQPCIRGSMQSIEPLTARPKDSENHQKETSAVLFSENGSSKRRKSVRFSTNVEKHLYVLSDVGLNGKDEQGFGNGVAGFKTLGPLPPDQPLTEEQLAAEAEWNRVTAIRDAQLSAAGFASSAADGQDVSCAPIQYEMFFKYLIRTDISGVKPSVVVFDASIAPPRKTCLFYMTCGMYKAPPPKLRSSELTEERLMVFCFARLAFDDSNVDHVRAIRTLYSRLTGTSTRQCPRFGSHWETIGFQGSDPATDLRGGGLLGLLQLLFISSDSLFSSLTLDIHTLSRSNLASNKDFPFAVTGINLTKVCLEALRSGVLNCLINRWDSVFLVVNRLYIAMFYLFYLQWKPGSLSIHDFSHVISEIKACVLEDPEDVIDTLMRGLCERRARVSGAFVLEDDVADISNP